MPRLRFIVYVAALALIIGACSRTGDGTRPTGTAPDIAPTSTPGETIPVFPTAASPDPEATSTSIPVSASDSPNEPTPTPTRPVPDSTPTSTPETASDFPDGPLLALTPPTDTKVTSQAVLIRGTVESGSTVLVNGVDTEVDLSGDFFVAVIVGLGENIVVVEVTGADGTRVRRDLRVIGS